MIDEKPGHSVRVIQAEIYMIMRRKAQIRLIILTFFAAPHNCLLS
jgi:hypothetical protein